MLSWKPGWQSAQRKILFLSSQMRSHFRQVGQRQATGWWGVGGLPQSRSGPPITRSKGGPVGIRQDLPQGTGCTPHGRAKAVCQPLSPSPSQSPAVFGQRQPEVVPGMEGQSQSCWAGRGADSAQPPPWARGGGRQGWASCRAAGAASAAHEQSVCRGTALQRVSVSTEPRGRPALCVALGRSPRPVHPSSDP